MKSTAYVLLLLWPAYIFAQPACPDFDGFDLPELPCDNDVSDYDSCARENSFAPEQNLGECTDSPISCGEKYIRAVSYGTQGWGCCYQEGNPLGECPGIREPKDERDNYETCGEDVNNVVLVDCCIKYLAIDGDPYIDLSDLSSVEDSKDLLPLTIATKDECLNETNEINCKFQFVKSDLCESCYGVLSGLKVLSIKFPDSVIPIPLRIVAGPTANETGNCAAAFGRQIANDTMGLNSYDEDFEDINDRVGPFPWY
uniref:Uncharacterized protein n=1 Tax=Lotharella oceanica TaxID=641309 RepID=A0A7S2TYS4_9EUKA